MSAAIAVKESVSRFIASADCTYSIDWTSSPGGSYRRSRAACSVSADAIISAMPRTAAFT